MAGLLNPTLLLAATKRLGGCVQTGIAFTCPSTIEIDLQVAQSAKTELFSQDSMIWQPHTQT
jgi:hypothetical protein